MKEKILHIVTIAVFALVIGAGVVLNLAIEKPDFIPSERRRPAPRPDFSRENVISGTFAREFDVYSADNFVFREELRRLRAITTFHVFMQSDRGGLFFDHRGGIANFTTFDEAEYHRTAARIASMFELFPSEEGQGMNLHFAVIPDKSYYSRRSTLSICPHTATRIMSSAMPEVNFIDISGDLTIDDFYRTDLHWDQTRLWEVMRTLSRELDFSMPTATPIIEVDEFFGVYYGQLSLPMRPDFMRVHAIPNELGIRARYLNERLSGQQMTAVTDRGPIYDYPMFRGVDPYSIFLRGPQPIVWIDVRDAESPEATGRNLYIFRDSFASSIAPLLALSGSYDQIVLIDIRYIDGRILQYFVEFTPGSDVLFLYNTQSMNSSSMFRGR